MSYWAALVERCAERGLLKRASTATRDADKERHRKKIAALRAKNPEHYRAKNREHQAAWRARQKGRT